MLKLGINEGEVFYIYDSNFNAVEISHRDYIANHEPFLVKTINMDEGRILQVYDHPDDERNISLSEKIAEIAHEVNNPLAIVNSSLKVLEKLISKEQIKNLDMITENFDDIRASIERIKNVFVHARTEVDQDEVSFHRVSLVELISGVRSNFSLLFSEMDVNLVVNIEDGVMDAQINVIGTTLTQCLFNLINNAYFEVKKNDGPKIINLNISKNSDHLFFSIIDNGRGVPKDSQEKIFELNYTTKADEGSGIGLFLVRKYIQMNKGSVSYDSSYTSGAKFDFKIPFESLSESKKTILVVDDELDILDIIKSDAAKTYNVLLAKDGNSAFNLLKYNQVDAIISDYRMPKLTGLDFFEMVRSINSTIPFVLFSGQLPSDVEKYSKGRKNFYSVAKPEFASLMDLVIKVA
ncbi:hybrid sensor histidine kinase/response regulator [Halobacteriovorax sp. HLS]|uniref:ATP-binding response regulator n=1 Tax=Halobacteriovorax sp. HLS TaxID=2234000 RepID=UPI000FD862E1|nr:hybrid sensor histidine kinase/response regulator [Halobacteriovorax sp. HLS]